MRASLVSRELIADSIELVVRRPHVRRGDRAQRLRQDDPRHRDGAVPAGRPERDALRRLDPARRHYHGERVTIQEVFEAVGAHAAGRITDAELTEIEDVASPGAGACGGQFTANTMAMAFEVLGISPAGLLDGPGRRRAQGRGRRAGRRAGRWTCCAAGCARATSSPARAWRTRSPRSPAAAARPTASCTCWRSPRRWGSSSSIDEFDEISERTPLLCDLKPGGRYVAPDLYAAGGVPLVMQAPAGGGPAARGRDHGHRQDDRRGRRRRAGDRGPAGRPAARRTRSSPPAAWRSCTATSPPTAASSSSPAMSDARRPARRGCSSPRRTRWPPSPQARSTPATSS